MKKIIKGIIGVFVAGGACLIGIILYFGDFTQSDFSSTLSFSLDSLPKLPPTIFSLPGEDSLSISQFAVTYAMADTERTLFSQRIAGIDTTSREAAGRVDSAAFGKLYDQACRLQEFEPNEKFVTMLKIYMGRDEDTRKMVLLYQPMYFIHKSSKDSTVKYKSGKFNDTLIYFIYEQKKIKPITQEEADVYINNYKKNIRIKNSRYDFLRRFNWTTDNPKDVEAVLFSFQEIFALLRDNLKTANCVFILNVASGPTHGKKEYYIKHSLILSSQITSLSRKRILQVQSVFRPLKGPTPSGVIPTPAPLEGKCANLGNHCPPEEVEYTVK